MGADVNARGGVKDGAALSEAARTGHADIVRFLLSRGALLDVSEPTRNPLFGAVLGGHIEIVKLLIDAGIDTEVRYTGESMTDMDAAAFAHEGGQLEIEQLLLSLRKKWLV